MAQAITARSTWQLTKTAFDRLLEAFSEDTAEAGEKYLRLERNLIRFFEVRGIDSPEDAADEVIDRLARKLESGERFENVATYALGIARLVALEIYKRPKVAGETDLPELAVAPDEDETDERVRKLECLDECLAELTPEKREIIVGYYEGEKRSKIENRARLASRLNIPANALRNRAVRLRGSLESCIMQCIGGKM